jgi:hypothetical protein
MYHLDQIAAMLSVDLGALRQTYIYYNGLTPGPPRKDRIRAVNIAPSGQEPEWRVTEKDLIRWLKVKGIRFYTRGYV